MAARKVVVGLLSDQQDFQLVQAEDARAAAERAGLQVDVVFAENNAVLQVQQLFSYVHLPEEERPAAIVAETVTGEGLARVARNAVRAGIGRGVLNRTVDYLQALRQERGDLPIASVSVDNAEVGRIQGRQLKALLPKGGPVLYLEGPADTAAAADRLLGTQEAIRNAGFEMKLLQGDWTEESGEKAVAAWLRLKTSEGFLPVAIAAQNDSMAIGARRAARSRRREWADVPFLGCDGLPEGGQKLVRDHELTATVITPTTAGAAITLVARALAGEQPAAELKLAPQSFPPESRLRPLRR